MTKMWVRFSIEKRLFSSPCVHTLRINFCIYPTTLFIYITLDSLRSFFSAFARLKRDVYDDNYASRDEEKRTDDEYQELFFVF